jgi:hypothetical protein
MNFWVVPNTTDVRRRTFPLSRFGTKKKRNRTKRPEREGERRRRQKLHSPPTHAAPHPSFSLLRVEEKGEAALSRLGLAQPFPALHIPLGSQSRPYSLLVAVDGATPLPVAGGPDRGRGGGGGMDPEKRGYKFRILSYCCADRLLGFVILDPI